MSCLEKTLFTLKDIRNTHRDTGKKRSVNTHSAYVAVFAVFVYVYMNKSTISEHMGVDDDDMITKMVRAILTQVSDDEWSGVWGDASAGWGRYLALKNAVTKVITDISDSE
jgi:hypothetical protein